MRRAAGGVEAALGRDLGALFRNEAGGVRAVAQRDRQHLVGRRHLEIERAVDLARQAGDVVVRDVAPVLAQMGGDAVGACRGGEAGGPHRIGMAAAARVPDGGDVVDIDAEAEVASRHVSRAPARPS